MMAARSPLEAALKVWFPAEAFTAETGYELAVRALPRTTRFFGIFSRQPVIAIVLLRSDDIRFGEMAGKIIARASGEGCADTAGPADWEGHADGDGPDHTAGPADWEVNVRGVSGKKASGKRINLVDCDWFICSERGGIYLYEAIATPEHRSFAGMRNRFVVLNLGTGAVSFGPGDERNAAMSDRLSALLESYRLAPDTVTLLRLHDTFDFFRACLR